MKTFKLWMPFRLLALAMFLSLVSCSKAGQEPEIPGSDPNVKVPDPEGTITVNVINNGESVYLENLGRISMKDNNFEGDYISFVSVGPMMGLGNVVNIPSSGYASTVAVMLSYGYVIKMENTYGYYGRMYVDRFLTGGDSTVIGATIKYQVPFEERLQLHQTEIVFDAEGGTETVPYAGTPCQVESKPDWISVLVAENVISVTAQPNYTAYTYRDSVVFANSHGSVSLLVIQNASESPLFSSGRGTETDPFSITEAAHLDNVRKFNSSGYFFSLQDDIDLGAYIPAEGNGWEPIGTSDNGFMSVFSGNGHTVSGLWIDRPNTDYIGLFGYAKNALISDVRLVLGEKGITGGSYIGGIIGRSMESVISGCSVNGNISGNSYVGGIVGAGSGDFIECCYTEGTLCCTGNVGGIIAYGDVRQPVVSDCYSLCTITCDGYPVGIGGNANARYCYFAGKIITNLNLYYYNYISENYEYCYYSAKTTGDENGLSEKEMMRQSTYENWDFTTVWQIDEGRSYPTLRCFNE